MITFICDPFAEVGSPKFLYEASDCSFRFEWYSNMTCQHEAEISASDSSSAGGWIALVIILAMIIGFAWIKRSSFKPLVSSCWDRFPEVVSARLQNYQVSVNLHAGGIRNCFDVVKILNFYRKIKYSRLSGSMVPEDDEDDLLFGVESVDDSVFPLVPDSLVDSG